MILFLQIIYGQRQISDPHFLLVLPILNGLSSFVDFKFWLYFVSKKWNRVAFRKVTKQGSIAMLPSKNGNFLMVRSGSFEFLAECLHCYRCHQWNTWGRVFGDPPLHTDITFCLVPSIFRHAPTSSSTRMFRNLASSHLLLGSFSNDDGDGYQDFKKAIRLLRKTILAQLRRENA